MNASSWSYFFALLITISIACTSIDNNLTVPTNTQNSTNPTKKPQSRRQRKQVTTKTKRSRTYVQNMEYDELLTTQKKAITQKQFAFAIKCTEQLIKLCNESSDQAELLLCLAQLYYDNDDFEQAVQAYTEFSLLYPGKKENAFALYQAIRAQAQLTMDIDRDQTNTERVIAMADEFLAHPLFVEYRPEVIALRAECYQKLVEQELYVCTFYINAGDTRAAQRRIDFARETYGNCVDDLETQLLIVEQLLHKDLPTITIKQADAGNTTVAESDLHTAMKNKF